MSTSTVTPAPPTVPGYVDWIAKRLLRSRLHALLSRRTMLLSFTGRKSGKLYVAVVRYVREGDLVTCYTDSKWWINLRDNATVELLIGGQTRAGVAEVVEDPAAVADSLTAFLHTTPGDSKYYGVRRDADGLPEPHDIIETAKRTKLIRITLAQPAR